MSPTEAPPMPKFVNGKPIPEHQMPEEKLATVVEPEEETGPVAGDSQLDDLEIQVEHREWVVEGDFTVQNRDGTIRTDHFKRAYMQKPLSFTAMLQFTGLLGEKISEAMSGPDGLSIDAAMSEGDSIMGAGRAMLTGGDFAGVDSFIKGLAKLASYVPDVVEECQCIWLRVPYAERVLVKEIWSRPASEGGLSANDGMEMLELFLAQNYQEVEDFFDGRAKHLVALIQKLRNKSQAARSQRSKPSKRTQQDTPSQ